MTERFDAEYEDYRRDSRSLVIRRSPVPDGRSSKLW